MKTSDRHANEGGERPDGILPGRGLWGGRLLRFDTLGSTNGWAMGHLDVCLHGDVVWAVRQTGGKGRLSRSWLSPGDKGLAVSIVLKDLGQNEILPILGQIAALSVKEVLRECSIRGLLKWPNDVMVKDKKIAGILAQTDSKQHTVVLGVGVNVNAGLIDFKGANLEQLATSMLMETGQVFDVENVRERIVSEFERELDLGIREGISYVLREWTATDWLTGSTIQVGYAQGTVTGKYGGLDERGRLRLIDGNGEERVFWAGDVEKLLSERRRFSL